MGCCGSICAKCIGVKYLIMGIVILVVAMKWSGYIWHTIGALLILKGVFVFVKPDGCGHCSTTVMPKGKKK